MSEVFEGYERQYCELSENLSRKCTSAGALNGGNHKLNPNSQVIHYVISISMYYRLGNLGMAVDDFFRIFFSQDFVPCFEEKQRKM